MVGTISKGRISEPSQTRRQSWRWQHYLAMVGLLFLVWEAWTLIAWLSDGPDPITQYRDTSSGARTAARIYEVGMIALSVVVAAYVIRGCRTAGRLTFDAMLVIASGLSFWLDPLLNFYQPLDLYSSNWTNVGNWCGHAPFLVNKTCGDLPEPIIFIGLMYTFGFLTAAIVACALARAARRRWPSISNGRIIALFALSGVAFNTVMETPILLMHLWYYASFPDSMSIFLTHNVRLPWAYAIPASVLAFGALGMARFFKDDRGDTVFERGLGHLGNTRRQLVTLFSVIGFMQVLVFVGIALLWIFGPYASPWRDAPRHVINGICDTSGFTDTPYGTCPGDPGYQAPIRHLPS